MDICKFEPGDRTSYYVIFHRLTELERKEVSGGADCLFGFGTRGEQPYRIFPFIAQTGQPMFEGYFREKMGFTDKDTWTMSAGLLVFSYLTGRPVTGPTLKIAAEMEWDLNWHDQLEGLDRVLDAKYKERGK